MYIYESKGIETSIRHNSRVEGEERESEAKTNAIPLLTDPRRYDGKESGIQNLNEEHLLNHIQARDGGCMVKKGDGDATTFHGK